MGMTAILMALAAAVRQQAGNVRSGSWWHRKRMSNPGWVFELLLLPLMREQVVAVVVVGDLRLGFIDVGSRRGYG